MTARIGIVAVYRLELLRLRKRFGDDAGTASH